VPALLSDQRLNSLVRSRGMHGRSDDGKISAVENTSPCDDDWDVAIGLAGSGVVHVTTRANKSTGSASECSHGGHDRCICGMARSREG